MAKKENDCGKLNRYDVIDKLISISTPIGLTLCGGPIAALLAPVLSEIVSNFIPNQRWDRCARQLEKLSDHIHEHKHDIEILKKRSSIIEEGFRLIGETPFEDRCDRLANIIANGLINKEFNSEYYSMLLRIVRTISAQEIVVLSCHYASRNFGENQEDRIINEENKKLFEEQHPEIWPASLETEDNRKKKAYLRSYEQHLASLGLVTVFYTSFGPLITNNLGGKNRDESTSDVLREIINPKFTITRLGCDVLENIKAPENLGQGKL